MSNQDKLVSALEATVEAQKQLIKHLTAEIDRLNLTRLVVNPAVLQPFPSQPFYQPQPNFVPFITPINPLEPPFKVTCDNPAVSSGVHIVLNGGIAAVTN